MKSILSKMLKNVAIKKEKKEAWEKNGMCTWHLQEKIAQQL